MGKVARARTIETVGAYAGVETPDGEPDRVAIPPELLRDIERMDPLPVTVQHLKTPLGEEIASPVRSPEVMTTTWVSKIVGVGVGSEEMSFNMGWSVSRRPSGCRKGVTGICFTVADLMVGIRHVHGGKESH